MNAATEIRQQALLAPNGPAGRPLPLVSHWNMGSQGRGWTPQYQLELLAKGHHILPWLGWPRGDPDASDKNAQRFADYYNALLAYCREHRLPICFRGTQWEAMLVKRQYRELPPEKCPAVITPEGKTIAKLSPFGPVDPWRDPAAEYVDTPAMKKLQSTSGGYPDPPLVLFVSNNEAPDLRWHQVEQSKRYLDKYRNVNRWFLLDTNLDPPRPWEHKTNIPVFSLALVQGDTAKHRWLIYAHSPLEDRQGVNISVPGFGKITVDVTRAGAFYLIDEAGQTTTPITTAL